MLDVRWRNGQKTAYRLVKEFIILNKLNTREQILFACKTLDPLLLVLDLNHEQKVAVYNALCAQYVLEIPHDDGFGQRSTAWVGSE